MNQLNLILENIRLSHIEKLLLEAQTEDELQRGVALINESMQTVAGLIQEFDLSTLGQKATNFINRKVRGCTGSEGYTKEGDCSSYDAHKDNYITGRGPVNDGDGNYRKMDNSYHNQDTEYDMYHH
jgi:hypothetical protein